jgi:hypothetical protein
MKKFDEMFAGYDPGAYKYLCFYHKAFPFFLDSWGFDCSNSKQKLLDEQYPLFSPQDISERVSDETFWLVLNSLASDPQLVLCSDGEYRIFRCAGSAWGWVGVPSRFTKKLWKKLSSQYRSARSSGFRLHRTNMIALDYAQFAIAQRLIRQVFDDEDGIATHEIKDEF